MNLFLLLLALLPQSAHALSTIIRSGTGRELAISASGALTVTSSGTTQAVQSGSWSVGRTWNLSSALDSVGAVQSGTWNIANISGAISLPTGAATSANQATLNSYLADIDTKTNGGLNTTETQAQGAWSGFGQIQTASTAQVAVMGSGYNYLGANVSAYLASSSTADALAGTGCQKITLTYFKADGSGPFSETDNMLGTTGFFSSSTMAFVSRAYCSQVGLGATNAGNILISSLSPLSTLASITAGDTETYYAHHFVPLGKTTYLNSFTFGSAAVAAAQGAKFLLKVQKIPLASNAMLSLLGPAFLVGSSSTQSLRLQTPIAIVGPAIITVQVIPDSATANTFACSIGGYEQ